MNAQERAEILDRLAAGQINVAEAMRLLDPAAGSGPAEALKVDVPAADDSPADDIPVEELKASVVPDMPTGDDLILKKAAANGNDGESKPRWLKIRVSDRRTGNSKVNVTLPIGLVNFGLGVARHLGADIGSMGTDELLGLIKSEQRGMLVEVNDEEDDEQVLIYLD